jgi:hypothetical protein
MNIVNQSFIGIDSISPNRRERANSTKKDVFQFNPSEIERNEGRKGTISKGFTMSRYKSNSPYKIQQFTDKEKRQILEHYRKMFSYNRSNEDNYHEPYHRVSNKTGSLIKNTKFAAFENLNSTQKSEMFKSSIYSLLIPTRNNMINTMKNSNVNNSSIHENTSNVRNMNHTDGMVLNRTKKQNQEYGPYLNFNYDEFNKKIEIKNPEVKKCLEDINYYGPYFSHCPSCKNKNLDFYQTLETHQCLKLLNFIKKTRTKKLKKRKNRDEENRSKSNSRISNVDD